MAKNNIQETETKVKSKSKKTKKVIETENVADVKVDVEDNVKVDVEDNVKVDVEGNVKVDVEIDLRSYNHSDVVGGYIRRKRSI